MRWTGLWPARASAWTRYHASGQARAASSASAVSVGASCRALMRPMTDAREGEGACGYRCRDDMEFCRSESRHGSRRRPLRGRSLQRNPQAPIVPALVLDLEDPEPARGPGRAEMRAAAGLAIEADDLDDANFAVRRRR